MTTLLPPSTSTLATSPPRGAEGVSGRDRAIRPREDHAPSPSFRETLVERRTVRELRENRLKPAEQDPAEPSPEPPAPEQPTPRPEDAEAAAAPGGVEAAGGAAATGPKTGASAATLPAAEPIADDPGSATPKPARGVASGASFAPIRVDAPAAAPGASISEQRVDPGPAGRLASVPSDAAPHAPPLVPETPPGPAPTGDAEVPSARAPRPAGDPDGRPPSIAAVARLPHRADVPARAASVSEGRVEPSAPSDARAAAPPPVESAPSDGASTSGAGPDDGDHEASRRPAPVPPRFAPADRSAPAVARAVQVENAVRLENIPAPAVGAEAAPRGDAPTPGRTVEPLGGVLDRASAAVLLGNGSSGGDEVTTARVLRGLGAMVNQRGGVMTMRLSPPELGELRIRMSIVRGQVSADFFARHPQASALLERNLGALRQALESNGLHVERLGVHASGPDASSSARGGAPEGGADQGAPRDERPDAGGGQSRGRSPHEQGPEGGRADVEAFVKAFDLHGDDPIDGGTNS